MYYGNYGNYGNNGKKTSYSLCLSFPLIPLIPIFPLIPDETEPKPSQKLLKFYYEKNVSNFINNN